MVRLLAPPPSQAYPQRRPFSRAQAATWAARPEPHKRAPQSCCREPQGQGTRVPPQRGEALEKAGGNGFRCRKPFSNFNLLTSGWHLACPPWSTTLSHTMKKRDLQGCRASKTPSQRCEPRAPPFRPPPTAGPAPTRGPRRRRQGVRPLTSAWRLGDGAA